MANHTRNEDEIGSEFEKALERAQTVSPTKVQKLPDLKPIVITRIKTFTCPACNEVLEDVTAINSMVKGWCGRSHSYVKHKID